VIGGELVVEDDRWLRTPGVMDYEWLLVAGRLAVILRQA